MSLEYRWPDGNRCAVVLSFDFDAESPYLWSTRNGERRLLGELEQRRFGPRQGIHRILELLARLEKPATFFVPGWTAETYPSAVESIAAGEHEIGLHGYLHERVDELDEKEIEETITSSKKVIRDIVGQTNFGYRSPSWELTDEALTVLRRQGILYDSSLMGYDHPYWVEDIPEVPVQWILDDAPFYRYTGGPGAGGAPRNPSDVVDIWKGEFRGMKAYGGLLMVTMHPWLTGRAGRLDALAELISYIGEEEVWWTTCREVASYHREAYPLDK